MLVSHYDTQTATVHGAYDDKSGVAAQFHICKALAQLPMNKTLACVFFDAEEQGLIARARYVEDIQDETDEYVYDHVLGYDMTGINWPGHDWEDVHDDRPRGRRAVARRPWPGGHAPHPRIP